MNRWSRIERRALLRRFAWAGGVSAMLHAAVLAVIELPDPEAMQRAQWPQVDVRFARLTQSSVSERPSPDAPPAQPIDLFDAAAAVPPRPRPETVAEAPTRPAPRANRDTRPARTQAKQPAIIMAGPVSMPPNPDGDDGAPSEIARADAGTPEHGSRAHVGAAAFPKKLELEYVIQEADGETALGWMVYRFEREGERYRIRAAIDAIGVASFFVKGRYLQHSEGRLTADGLQPERFTVRRGRRERVERASFDWQALRATLSDAQGSREWTLQAGAQDQLSLVHQIAFLMGTGDAPRVPVTDGRHFVTAQIEVVGRETVQTELGPMQTVRIRAELEKGANLQLWLAPDFGYLPARLRLRDKRGREADQVLSSVKVQW